MYKSILVAICGCFFGYGAFSQPFSIDHILKQVEQNNQELKAISNYLEGQRLELKSTNTIPDLQFGAYYLPFGNHNTGEYTEFQISQSFEFPSVYRTRGKLIEQQSALLELEFQTKRQEVLKVAKDYCLQIIYLNKRLQTEVIRVEQAKQVFNQVQELYVNKQVGLLELNKAKVAWFQERFKIDQIKSDLKNTQVELVSLNGGVELSYDQSKYDSPLISLNKDSIWQQKLANDPAMMKLNQQELVSQQTLKLAKNKSLPDLMAGYNSQGVFGERFSGVYAGLSFPLWSNRYKVKQAKSFVNFYESVTSARTLQVYSSLEQELNDYQNLLAKFQEYDATLTGMDSDKLLLQTYQLGELSFLEYYMELQFYHKAYDALLEMQYHLYLSQNELLKHQL